MSLAITDLKSGIVRKQESAEKRLRVVTTPWIGQ